MSSHSCPNISLNYTNFNSDYTEIPIPDFTVTDSYPSLPQLHESASLDGCELCLLFIDTINKKVAEVLIQNSDQKAKFKEQDITVSLTHAKWITENYEIVAYGDANGAHTLAMELELWEGREPEKRGFLARRSGDGLLGRCSLYFSIHVDEEDEIARKASRIRRHRFLEKMDSMEMVHLVRKWTHDCSQNHPECSLVLQTSFVMPTRLVDVGDGYKGRCRLVETAREGVVGRYLALSYCWGKEKFLDTTIATLAERKEGIEFKRCSSLHRHLVARHADTNGKPWFNSSLPQTLQDAVQITRLFGIRYIWIDSLCIIQDSPKDWNYEASVMNEIYNHAYLVLAAVSASNASDGFLNRKSAHEAPIILPVTTSPGLPASLNPTLITAYLCSTPRFDLQMEDDINLTTWNSRAWTLQERYLSARILYFTTRQVYFSCGANYQSENNEPPPWYELPLRFFGARFVLDPPSPGALARPPELPLIYKEWYWIVGQYTIRDLSFGKDKLPAIRGLANELLNAVARIQDRWERYLAGLWEGDLAYGLLWIRAEEARTSWEPEEGYRAPSWSWASCEGRVRHNMADSWVGENRLERKAKAVFEMVNFVVEYDEAGRDQRWRLEVEGAVVRVELMLGKLGKEVLGLSNLKKDEVKEDVVHGFVYDVVDFRDRRTIGRGCLDYDPREISGDSTEGQRREIWCFPVCDQIAEEGWEKWSGLLLDMGKNSQEGEEIFRRIGAYYLFEDCVDVFADSERARIKLV